jgi:ABC-2 type transport system ATP-binding protein
MPNILLSLRDIVKRYGSRDVLQGISFNIEQGEIVSLLGPNGAGKTTLSAIIAALKAPTAGDVIWQGISIYKDVPAFRYKIGYCQQKCNLNDELSLYDNLAYAGLAFGMTEAAVKHRIDELSQKLSLGKYLEARSYALSGGFKQRFMIARSLMHSPNLLILDEPTVALDPHVRRQLWEYIKLLKEDGVSVLLTTHYLDEAEYLSDRVVVLDAGKITHIDTPRGLMAAFKKDKLEDVFIHLMQELE